MTHRFFNQETDSTRRLPGCPAYSAIYIVMPQLRQFVVREKCHITPFGRRSLLAQ